MRTSLALGLMSIAVAIVAIGMYFAWLGYLARHV